MGVAKTRRKRLRQVRPAYLPFDWVLGGTEGIWFRAICVFLVSYKVVWQEGA